MLRNLRAPGGATWKIPLAGVVLLVVACTVAGDEAESPAAAPEFRPTATIQDIMLAMVDPSADAIWESVATIVTIEGVEERRPETDEEWMALHDHAVRLVEATNLLLMEGREVARPGFRSENPGIELEPEEIQELLDADRESWNGHVRDLYEQAKVMLDGIDQRDPQVLFDNGGALDHACETCHRQYWYPDPQHHGPPERDTVGGPQTPAPADSSAADAGVIQGHVGVHGKIPGNRVVRMGADPKCAELYRDERPVEDAVLADAEGNLANVFVRLEGAFPASPVPNEPVVIDQKRCFFVPRVAGVRAGQPVVFRNGDALAHNVHAASSRTNSVNLFQPAQGSANEVRFAAEDEMVEIQCDLHRWMRAYLGVVEHPFFAVSRADGEFEISGVPAGEYTLSAWHERLGSTTETVRVERGERTTVELSFSPGAS